MDRLEYLYFIGQINLIILQTKHTYKENLQVPWWLLIWENLFCSFHDFDNNYKQLFAFCSIWQNMSMWTFEFKIWQKMNIRKSIMIFAPYQ
jgi:hypothetical protein